MTPNILNNLKARNAATNSKRLGSLAKANAEILNLAKSAGYSGNDPEAGLVHLERRNTAAVNAPLVKTSVLSTNTERKSELWAQYHKLPVADRNAFYKRHRTEMADVQPSGVVRMRGGSR